MVKTGRVMLGETNPADSKPGTIRGDLCIQVGRCALVLLYPFLESKLVASRIGVPQAGNGPAAELQRTWGGFIRAYCHPPST